jgi:beta-1,4-mannosyl-glycoprotein beta-1,4-N-acetylglucosaminyltransferase
MAKVYDVFTFFNELELLEIRLEMLNNIVDRFVIVECVETFSGNQKPLYYEENKSLFKKYQHKIIHHVTYDPLKSFEDAQSRLNNTKTDFLTKEICNQALNSTNIPKGEVHWLKEFYQKENIRRPLIGLDDNDLCIVSDLDEMWNPNLNYSNIENYKIYKLNQIVYSQYLNNRSDEIWAGTLLTRYRNIKNSCLNHLRTPSKTSYEYIENGGWHFTFMGGKEQIKLKIESYGHQEFNNSRIKNSIEKNLLENKDVLERNMFNFWIDESGLPKHLIDNKQKYQKYFKLLT